ncbi:Spc98 family-domain-containing protein [Boletus reticuloceps]|uniref:Spindle pole body component n=1 Tax=Boletus reticuloceps TaxID=495285 RepID=A0A8I2YL15_9AGAM|nr:Spc98 family-domain-containing protein [Boletus reticuloceps]
MSPIYIHIVHLLDALFLVTWLNALVILYPTVVIDTDRVPYPQHLIRRFELLTGVMTFMLSGCLYVTVQRKPRWIQVCWHILYLVSYSIGFFHTVPITLQAVFPDRYVGLPSSLLGRGVFLAIVIYILYLANIPYVLTRGAALGEEGLIFRIYRLIRRDMGVVSIIITHVQDKHALPLNWNRHELYPPTTLELESTKTIIELVFSTASFERLIVETTVPHLNASKLAPISTPHSTNHASFTSMPVARHPTVDFVSKNLEYAIKAGASTDMTAMDKHFRGYHVLKASINSHDDLADALQESYRKVKQQAKELTDLDERIKLSRLPDHLQLLILLSSAPSSATHAFAQTYKDARPSKPPVPVTWKEILAEEPFEGQHWEGVYGIPPGSTVEGWETRSGGSTPSLSPWDEDDSLNSDGTPSSFEDLPPPVIGSPENSHFYHLIHYQRNHFELVEQLKARQYWRDDWKIDVDVSRPFHIGDPSTLGPASLRVLGERATLALVGPEREKYIHERDAVREVLMCLQGRKNLMIYTTPDTFSSVVRPSPTAPRLLHFTSTAQSSILGAFAQVTTTVCHLRKFVSAIFDGVSGVHEITPSGTMRLLTHNIRSRTIEAFADAMDTQIQIFDRWCAEKEETICRAQAGCGDPLLVSLLSLEKDVRDTFSGIFDVVLDILHRLVGYICQSHSRLDQAVWNMPNMPTQLPSAVVSALLLDLLLQATEEQWSMGNVSASSSLAAVFAKTSEPIWHMIGKWLKDGMPVRNTWDSLDDNRALDEEFFIEDNELPLLDPDLWADGYVLRSPAILEDGERKQPAVPAFLGPVVDHVLEAGKAVGLLRMMGIHFFSENATDEQHPLPEWKSFTRLFESNAGSLRDSESLSHLISEELSAYCLAAGLRLSRLLTEECELSRHLAASQGLYLMTRGDVISNFTDVIFAKMDSQQAWNDFHFLNSAFRDVVESANSDWIDASLIRLAYRGSKATTISNTVKAIEGLLVEYAVPFPLTYIFTPSVLQSYCSLFVFLLQVRKAKCVLERILLRGAVTNVGLRSELKVFYAMRGKLSWFIK